MKDISKEDKERIEKNAPECIPDSECKPGEHCFDCPCAAYTEGWIAGATAEHAHLSETIRELKTENQSLRDRVKELECEAIKFAKWLRVDSYAITNPKACYDGKNYNHTFQSYEQLYQLFKDDKGIIKRNEIL